MLIPCENEEIKAGDLVLYKYTGFLPPDNMLYEKLGTTWFLKSRFKNDNVRPFWIGLILRMELFGSPNSLSHYIEILSLDDNRIPYIWSTHFTKSFIKVKFNNKL